MSDEKPPENQEQGQKQETLKQEVVLEADAKDVEANKIFAVLAYFGILFLIPLLAAKSSPFARFHTNQGFILFLAWVVIAMIGWIPILGWLVALFGSIALFVFSIMGIINVLQGKMTKLPLIGQFEIYK